MSAAHPLVAVVIPAYNEGRRVADVVRSLPGSLLGVERVVALVIDDGSSDDTALAARTAGATVLRHRVNLGKGAALRTGCEGANRLGADAIVLMDADGQHLPGDLAGLVGPLFSGEVDVVLGSRRFGRGMPVATRAGNHILNGLLRALFSIRVSDSQCGFRAINGAAYPALRWNAADYAVETEMLVRIRQARLRWVEVPIATVYHDRYKGTQPLDGLRILRQMLAWRIGA
jgi:glycosyltransferase involved in cell wall biosynthesis